jgi:hypothetical protein
MNIQPDFGRAASKINPRAGKIWVSHWAVDDCTILIKIYPALSPTIRGWDRVDVSRCIWMGLLAAFLIGKHHQI